MASHYRTGSMTLIASGAVRHDAMVKLAEEKCAGLNRGEVPACVASHYVGGDFREVEDLEQAHVAYAFPGLSNSDPDYFVAQIYATALGGGTSSRLFQEAREKRGLCYSIYAFSNGFQDSGFLGVYAGTGEAEAGGNLRRHRGRDGSHRRQPHRCGSCACPRPVEGLRC